MENKERDRAFEVGELYYTRSTSNYDCITRYRVTRRTAKSIWVVPQTQCGTEIGDPFRRKLSSVKGRYDEYARECFSIGSHAWADVVFADSFACDLEAD